MNQPMCAPEELAKSGDSLRSGGAWESNCQRLK